MLVTEYAFVVFVYWLFIQFSY